MEIEEFIEQDILVFLDDMIDRLRAAPARAAPGISAVYLTRDYEKELFHALDKNHTVEAKKVLRDLKKEFDECPNGTQDKEKLKALLIQLYDKFKEHVDVLNTFDKLDAGIDIKNVVLEQPPAPQAPAQQAQQAPAQQTPQAPATPVPQEFPELRALLSKAETHLEKGELEHAAVAYKYAKQEAMSAGTLPPELFVRYRATFDSITRAVAERKEKAAQESDAQKAIEPAQEPKPEKRVEKQEQKSPAATTASDASGDAPKGISNNTPSNTSKGASNAVSRPATSAHEAHIRPIEDARAQWLPKLTSPEMDHAIVLQLEREKHELDALLKRNDIKGAEERHRRMRLLAQQLGDPKRARSAMAKLQRISDILKRMRSSPTYDEHRLVAVP